MTSILHPLHRRLSLVLVILPVLGGLPTAATQARIAPSRVQTTLAPGAPSPIPPSSFDPRQPAAAVPSAPAVPSPTPMTLFGTPRTVIATIPDIQYGGPVSGRRWPSIAHLSRL